MSISNAAVTKQFAQIFGNKQMKRDYTYHNKLNFIKGLVQLMKEFKIDTITVDGITIEKSQHHDPTVTQPKNKKHLQSGIIFNDDED